MTRTFPSEPQAANGDNDDDGTCVCGQAVAGANTLCCYDSLEDQEYEEMMEDD